MDGKVGSLASEPNAGLEHSRFELICFAGFEPRRKVRARGVEFICGTGFEPSRGVQACGRADRDSRAGGRAGCARLVCVCSFARRVSNKRNTCEKMLSQLDF